MLVWRITDVGGDTYEHIQVEFLDSTIRRLGNICAVSPPARIRPDTGSWSGNRKSGTSGQRRRFESPQARRNG